MSTNANNSWLSRLAPYTRFLMRWGWFIVLCMIVATVTTSFLPDFPASYSYTATLRVQVVLPTSADGKVDINNSTAFYTSLFASHATLSPLIPKYLPKYPGYSPEDVLSALQLDVTATPITDTEYVLLTATPDFDNATAKDATTLVNDVFNAAVQEMHLRRSKVVDDLKASLSQEYNQSESDATSTYADIQQLEQAHQNNSFYYVQKISIYNAETARANAIYKQLIALDQQQLGNSDLLKIVGGAAEISTTPSSAPTQGQRYALSPLLGLIMGLGGVLLASMFSSRVPLRGKKREIVLPRIVATIPTMEHLRNNQLQEIKNTSPCIPLFRHLKYQASEYERPLNLITVISPKGHEGKSLVATGLAIAAAQNELRAILVDANPQRPVIHTWFQASNTFGTLDAIKALMNSVSGSSPVQRTFDTRLGVVPIGNKQTSNDVLAEALPVDGLRTFAEQLRSMADIVIFDGPPLLSDANATNLIQISDVVLLVVDAQKSQSTAVVEAEHLLSTIEVPSAIVLNRAKLESVE